MKVLFSLFLLISTQVYAQYFENQGKMLASIQEMNLKKLIKALKIYNIDIASVSKDINVVDVVIDDNEYKLLRNLGFVPTILEVKGVTALKVDEGYKKPDQIKNILEKLHSEYRGLTELISIGRSLEGREIFALKISSNKEKKPTLLFNGMHHAREVMTPEVVLDVAEYLLSNYGKNMKVTHWVDSLDVWVLPMLNVDGNNKMWNEDSWWRKNTRGGFGVDLNRNYPYGFNSCDGSSANKNAQDYRGEFAASEPETRAMMNFVKEIRPVFNISYHSYSELVIYPYGCRPMRAETFEVVEGIGKDIAKKLGYKAGTAWELLYNADGGDIDFMYHEYGVIPYVIELNSRLEGFQPNYKRVRNKTVEKNREGWMHLLNRALESGVYGKTSFMGVVEVLKNGNKLQSYPLHQDGGFHLVLNPGEYELVFKGEDSKILGRESIILKDKLVRLNLK